MSVGAGSNREIVERYANAWPNDYEEMAKLRHPDFVEDWPQTKERIIGHEAYQKIHENYPGGLPKAEAKRIIGTEDRLVLSPSFIPIRVAGEGDLFTLECVNTYPDGNTYYVTAILELQDQKVRRQRTYFGPAFEAPEWRAQWVERY